MNNIKVSILVPAYNAEKYIERCLDSLIQQTLKDIEIIIINDGSTDATLEICEKFCTRDKRVHVYTKQNGGHGIARNMGIEKANGEFIGFVDADDYIDLDMYEKLYMAAESTQADWVYSYMEDEKRLEGRQFKAYDYGVVIDNPDAMKRFRSLYLGGLPTDKDDSFFGMSVCRPIFKKQIIDDYNVRFISERIINSEDILFNLDFLSHCNVLATANGSFYHYCHNNTESFTRKLNPNRYKMFKRLYSELKKRVNNEEELLRVQRRHLMNVRAAVVEKARWCTWNNLWFIRNDILQLIKDEELKEILNEYPINRLPFMRKVYFWLMRLEQPMLLIILAKLRYIMS